MNFTASRFAPYALSATLLGACAEVLGIHDFPSYPCGDLNNLEQFKSCSDAYVKSCKPYADLMSAERGCAVAAHPEIADEDSVAFVVDIKSPAILQDHLDKNLCEIGCVFFIPTAVISCDVGVRASYVFLNENKNPQTPQLSDIKTVELAQNNKANPECDINPKFPSP